MGHSVKSNFRNYILQKEIISWIDWLFEQDKDIE